jgi:hypothetical protein
MKKIGKKNQRVWHIFPLANRLIFYLAEKKKRYYFEKEKMEKKLTRLWLDVHLTNLVMDQSKILTSSSQVISPPMFWDST